MTGEAWAIIAKPGGQTFIAMDYTRRMRMIPFVTTFLGIIIDLYLEEKRTCQLEQIELTYIETLINKPKHFNRITIELTVFKTLFNWCLYLINALHYRNQ